MPAFPPNHIHCTPYGGPAADGWVEGTAWPYAEADRRRGSTDTLDDFLFMDDDLEDEYFLAGILELEREERHQAGILGRWPLWEIRQWLIREPERLETALGACIIVSGIITWFLWNRLAPWFTSTFAIGLPEAFCGAVGP